MIDIAKLKELVALMTANDLTEVELTDEKEGVSIKRGSPAAAPIVHYAAAPPAAAPQAGPAAPAPAAPAAPPAASGPAIESPMVGTCYLA
ncbi:MAG: acetyl-CoA carboxylase, biotin carboxyl carrier protein, partial [Planctomycetota bacterium]|nr:acetyl-CoA carboxylase, biotin carboxyl carrier protein [Planctomycetota bacterium]